MWIIETRVLNKFKLPYKGKVTKTVEVHPTIPRVNSSIKNKPRAFATPKFEHKQHILQVQEGYYCQGEEKAMVPNKEYVIRPKNRWPAIPLRVRTPIPGITRIIVYQEQKSKKLNN